MRKLLFLLWLLLSLWVAGLFWLAFQAEQDAPEPSPIVAGQVFGKSLVGDRVCVEFRKEGGGVQITGIDCPPLQIPPAAHGF